MTLPTSLLCAIGRAVHAAGGTREDADELVAAWRRLDADLDRRAARLRYEAEQVRCRCADGGLDPIDGRCGRCHGRLEATR